jgi:signal transduction histidine kinase
MSQAGPSGDPTAPLWAGVVVLRLVTFVFAAAVVVIHSPGYVRPWLGWTMLGVMSVWTVITVTAYLRPGGRRAAVVWTDVAVTAAMMLSSLWIHSPEQLAGVVPLITTVWASAPPIAAAVLSGPTAGVIGGSIMAITTMICRGDVNTDIARDAVLLVGSGFVVGLAAATARRAQERMARALRAEAATAERERLARSIHDSVLQVLARVRKRGAEVGGEAAELAELAGEQEIALRALVAAAPPESTEDGTEDLRPRLQVMAKANIQVAVPATAVHVPAVVVTELKSTVSEILTNVAKHAGPGARAWVLVEDLGDEVVVSVRDDGVGIPPGRLQEAESAGRMGVARSIRGRVTDMGGTISLETAPGAGTEWEIRVPRQPVARKGGGR